MDTNAHELENPVGRVPRTSSSHRERSFPALSNPQIHSCRFVFIRGSTELFRMSIHPWFLHLRDPGSI